MTLDSKTGSEGRSPATVDRSERTLIIEWLPGPERAAICVDVKYDPTVDGIARVVISEQLIGEGGALTPKPGAMPVEMSSTAFGRLAAIVNSKRRHIERSLVARMAQLEERAAAIGAELSPGQGAGIGWPISSYEGVRAGERWIELDYEGDRPEDMFAAIERVLEDLEKGAA